MLVAESLLLSAAGALAGVWFAQAAVRALVPYLASSNAATPTHLLVAIDARLVAVAAALALVSGVIAGLIPAWRASRVSPQVSLAASARGGMHGKRAARSMRVMVAAQVALSLVLVSGAAVMVRSFIGLTTAPTGVEPDRVLVALVGGGLAGPDAATRFDRITRIREALAIAAGRRGRVGRHHDTAQRWHVGGADGGARQHLQAARGHRRRHRHQRQCLRRSRRSTACCRVSSTSSARR